MGYFQPVKHSNLLFAALRDLIRRAVRSLVIAFCLVAIVFPLITALAVSEGLRFQAEVSVEKGADVYISMDQYGGAGAVPLGYKEAFSRLKSVSNVKARVVGRTYIGDRIASVVGLEGDALAELDPLVDGAGPKQRGEVLVGRGIAEAFGVEKGMRFTLAANKSKVFKAVALLPPSCLWGEDVLIMPLEEANEFFRMKGYASQLLIYTSSDSDSLLKNNTGPAGFFPEGEGPGIRLHNRHRTAAAYQSGYSRSGGIFIVLMVTGAALAVPALLITSSFGMGELSREIGLLKAMGWRTWEILEKVACENILISLGAVSLSILVSMAWIKGLNGVLLAQFFIAEIGPFPTVDVPSRYLFSHGLTALLLALGLTLIGSLPSTWIRAQTPPGDLLR